MLIANTCFSNTRGAQEQYSERFIFFVIDQKIHLASDWLCGNLSDRFLPMNGKGLGLVGFYSGDSGWVWRVFSVFSLLPILN